MNPTILFDGNIRIYENFLSEEDQKAFIEFQSSFNYDDVESIYYWDKRLLNLATVLKNGTVNALHPILPQLRILSSNTLYTLKTIDDVDWELSEANLMKMFKDSNPGVKFENDDKLEMHVHVDNEEHIERIVHWGAVYYPNDNYEGGELYYPDYDFTLKPKANSLVIHSGNTPHGVKKVISGNRFSIATLAFKKGDWNDDILPVYTYDEAQPWHYPVGYWGPRMPGDPIEGDLKIFRSDGTTAPYNSDKRYRLHDTSDTTPHNCNFLY